VPAWSARLAGNPMDWLREAAQLEAEHPGLEVELIGKRRVFLDAHGMAFELAASAGQLLTGAEEMEDDQDELSAMDLEYILLNVRNMQDLRLNRDWDREHKGQSRDLAHQAVLHTATDVVLMQRALKSSSDGLVELSEPGQIVPNGIQLDYIQCPGLAMSIDLEELLTRLDTRRGHRELLPATAAFTLTQDRLKQVPYEQDMIRLHFQVLMSAYGHQLSMSNARSALRLQATSPDSPTAWRAVVEKLVLGVPHYLPTCPEAHAMDYSPTAPYAYLHSTTVECSTCQMGITTREQRYTCYRCAEEGKACNLCVECAGQLEELKDRLRDVANEAPNGTLRPRVLGIYRSLDLEWACTQEVQAKFEAAATGRSRDRQAALDEVLDRLMPQLPQAECPRCRTRLTRHSWRYTHVPTRTCAAGYAGCSKTISHKWRQYSCPQCWRAYCEACAARLRDAPKRAAAEENRSRSRPEPEEP